MLTARERETERKNTRTQPWCDKKRNKRRREKWGKGENADNSPYYFMNRKCNLNKVVAYKKMSVCMRVRVHVCGYAICMCAVRSSVSKCSVCGNTGGLIHIIQT